MAKSTQKRLNSEFLANGGILEITQGEVYLKTYFYCFFEGFEENTGNEGQKTKKTKRRKRLPGKKSKNEA
ncbi:hypothetical protein ACXDBF_003153 [Cronobacter sakazakii]